MCCMALSCVFGGASDRGGGVCRQSTCNERGVRRPGGDGAVVLRRLQRLCRSAALGGRGASVGAHRTHIGTLVCECSPRAVRTCHDRNREHPELRRSSLAEALMFAPLVVASYRHGALCGSSSRAPCHLTPEMEAPRWLGPWFDGEPRRYVTCRVEPCSSWFPNHVWQKLKCIREFPFVLRLPTALTHLSDIDIDSHQVVPC